MSRSKKGVKPSLGRAIIKDKSKRRRGAGKGDTDSWLHTSELDDGYDWGRLNLRSVTEESKLDEFLSTAKLAGTEFTAERLNIKVVDPGVYTGLPTLSEYAEIKQAQEDHKHFLSIPRRPKWDSSTTPEQLDLMEREAFLEWRRNLAQLEENERLVLTPFEKNLEFWRQLWRVMERSDVVVQIVDARNPLLFRCEDLEKYVTEINPQKVNVLLISKADLLTSNQRQAWLEYFQKSDKPITVAFWSATKETERLKNIESHSDESPSPIPVPESDHHSPVQRTAHHQANTSYSSSESDQEDEDKTRVTDTSDSLNETAVSVKVADDAKKEDGMPCDEDNETATVEDVQTDCNLKSDTPSSSCASDDEIVEDFLKEDLTRLLTGEELIDLLLSVSPVKEGAVTTVGMVGYPNVGKSSTINALIQTKKVPVSATPGRTKHFQTLYLSDSLLLCDCPGLVFPTFVTTKAEMVCNGILPIDQMRDHVPPVSLVCSRVYRPILERTYGIKLPRPREGDDPNRPPYAEELCGAYGYVRGFMTTHGRPDGPRSARYILKDYVNGRLLYCHTPPGIDSATFNQFSSTFPGCQTEVENKVPNTSTEATTKVPKSEFDQEFFQQTQVRAIKKGGPGAPGYMAGKAVGEHEGKPWKKHNNRHKKEKTRRIQPTVF